jgi:hypothetical protein
MMLLMNCKYKENLSNDLYLELMTELCECQGKLIYINTLDTSKQFHYDCLTKALTKHNVSKADFEDKKKALQSDPQTLENIHNQLVTILEAKFNKTQNP